MVEPGLAQDQGLIGDLFETQAAPPRPGVAAADEDELAVAADRQGVDARVWLQLGQDGNLAAPGQERGPDLARVAETEGEPHPRMAPAEGGQEGNDVGGRVGADPQLPAGKAARAGQELLGLVLGRTQAPGHVEQLAAQVGQLDAAPAALEQAHPITLFQRLHLAGEGRLSDIEHGRRACIAAGRGDRVERPEMCVSYRHNLY